MGHSKSDPREYRTREEEEEWKAKCPIKRFEAQMKSTESVTESELDRINKEVVREIEETAQFVLESPYPAVENLTRDVYAPDHI
jgi:TPP-dependent pyruvate/acetoin dehydrogenase alpha subunit